MRTENYLPIQKFGQKIACSLYSYIEQNNQNKTIISLLARRWQTHFVKKNNGNLISIAFFYTGFYSN
jgi:hypothetical protein